MPRRLGHQLEAYVPGVPGSWVDGSPAQAKADFEKALKLDPYLNAARYNLAQHGHQRDEKRILALHKESEELKQALWEHKYDLIYTEMGRYGNVIGTAPDLRPKLAAFPMFDSANGITVQLAANTVWATKVEGVTQKIRDEHGGTIALLDYDKDGKPDVLMLSAVVRNGKLGDLLLHNEGGGRFVDRTAEMGLGEF